MKWVDIPGWENRYQISEYGDVWSRDMVVGAKSGGTAIRKGRCLVKVLKNNGYLCVTLTDGVNRPQIAIHKLVARAFIGECPLGLHVLHSDGDKQNNHYSNLRYGTPAENHEDTERHGHRLKGVTHPNAILDEDAIQIIRVSGRSAKELAAWFNVSSSHIHSIRKRRCWKHID